MRSALACAVLAAISIGCSRSEKPTSPAPAMVFFVRHAEKALDQGDDPGLTALGTARAAALAAMLEHSGAQHLFATEYRRTQLTLAPLAAKLGLTPRILSSKDAAAQLDALRNLPAGAIAVVAGHSNTVPPMVRALGGRAEDLADPDYDRVLVVSLVRTGTTTRATSAELRLVVSPPVD